MEPPEIERMRDSFVGILFAPQEAAGHFYGRLFARAPETRALFTGDMVTQAQRLIDALAKIVAGLSRPAAMRPTLEALAIRHAGYGVTEQHYPLVGDALLHMVREMNRPALDPALERAWSEAYSLISHTMIAAARGATGATTTPSS